MKYKKDLLKLAPKQKQFGALKGKNGTANTRPGSQKK